MCGHIAHEMSCYLFLTSVMTDIGDMTFSFFSKKIITAGKYQNTDKTHIKRENETETHVKTPKHTYTTCVLAKHT